MPTNEERLSEAIRQMAGFSVVDEIMPEVLHRIATLANQTIEPAAMVGLTMDVHGRPATPVFTDEAAPEIDSAPVRDGDRSLPRVVPGAGATRDSLDPCRHPVEARPIGTPAR